MTNRPTPASPSPAQTPRGRGLRYTLIGFAGLLALLMAGAAIGVATFDPNSLKPRIQEAVRQATGRDLALNGEIGVKLSLWPTIAVRDVGFANPPGFSRPHLLTLQGLELRLALLPLLTRRVAIERLALVGADIRLETRADGNRNWVLSLPPQPDRQAVATEATEPRRDPGLFASLGTLRIESGKLAWHDERTGQHHDLVIEALDVTSESDLAPLRINGGVTFDSVPVAITGETDSLARLLGSEPASPIRVAMTVKAAGAMASVEGSVTDPRGRRGYDGTLHVTLPDTAALAPLMPGVAIPAARDIALSARVRGQGTELPEIDGISLKTGVFVLPDPVKDTQIDRIEASAPSVAQPIALSIAGRRGGLPFTVSGSIGHPGLDAAALRSIPVDLRLSAANATVTVKGQIDKPSSLSGVALDIVAGIPDLSALSPLAGQPLPPLKSIDLRAQISGRDDTLSGGIAVRNLRLILPEADLAGEVSGDWSGHPLIHANLRSDRVDLDALRAVFADVTPPPPTGAQLANPPPQAMASPPAASRGTGVIPDIPLPFSSLRVLDVDIQARFGTLRWAKADYQAIEAHAVLRDGRLRLDPFAATTPEGRVTGTLDIDASVSNDPRVHLVAHAPSLATATILAALGARPVATGPLEVRADLTGTGTTLRAIAASLSGSFGAAMAGGTIDTRVLVGSVGSLVKELPILDLLGRGGGVADIRCVALRLDARDGVARSRVMLLSSSLLTADGGGTIDLRTETLNLLIRPQGRVGGNGFRVPVKISGPMRAPRFEIDAAGTAEANADRLAGIIIGRVSPQGGGPLGTLGGLLGGDALQHDSGSPCPPALSLVRDVGRTDTVATPANAAEPAPPAQPPAQRPRREAPALPNAERLLRQLFR